MGRKVKLTRYHPNYRQKLPVTCEGYNGPGRLAYSREVSARSYRRIFSGTYLQSFHLTFALCKELPAYSFRSRLLSYI